MIAVLFDLDGTLLNTLEDLKDSVNYALSTKGYPQRSVAEVREFIGNGIPKLIERAAPKNTSTAVLEELLASFRRYYRKNCAKNTCPFEGISELVATLKTRDYCLGVISNKSHAETVSLIREFFKDTFPFVLGNHENLPRKPHPAGIEEAMAYFHVSPTETIYIGDSDVDVATAHNGSVPCVGVTWGFRGREVLAAAGADYVIDTPMALLTILEERYE